MDFHRFPVDEQYCEVKFESFGFTNKQVWSMLGGSVWMTNLFVLDTDEVDGPITFQCECQHLPGPVFIQCPPDGLLQH